MSKLAAPPAAAAPAATAAPPKSLVKKLMVPAIIVAVVVVEWLAAMMFLPGEKAAASSSKAAHQNEEAADEVAAAGDEHGAASEHASSDDAHGAHAKKADKDEHAKGDKPHGGHGEKADGAAPAASKPHGEQAEVDLGEFTVTVYQHASSSTQFISFHLYGTVRHKSLSEFNARYEESKHRIRDNVIVIVRSAEMSDLTDAGLGLIKRRVLETTNKTLGKPLLQGVVFSDFSFVEQ
jgi:flagellar basal body-associated protein FliL